MTYREEGERPTLSPNKKHCYACANILDVRAEICPKCGVRQPVIPGTAMVPAPTAALTTTRTKTSAALFAFFLGGLGIHKFYLGQAGLGVLYLVFCWTFIPSLIGFVEGIIFLSMTEAEFAQRYPD